MLALSLVLFAASCAHLALAMVTLRRMPRGSAARRFALVALSTAVWLSCTVVIMHPWSSHDVVLWMARAAFVGATCLGISWLWFCLGFPQPSTRFRPLAFALMALGVPFLALWPTPLLIAGIGGAPYWATAHHGGGFGAFGLWVGLAFGVGIWHLHLKARALRGLARLQVRYVYLGFAALALGGFSTIIVATQITHNSRFAPLGAASSLLMSGIIAYAILKHRLLDVRLILTAGLAYTVAIGALSLVFAAVVATARLGMPNAPNEHLVVLQFAAMLALVLAVEPVRRHVRRWLARLFHKRAVEDRELLRLSGLTFARARDHASLFAGVVGALEVAVHPAGVAIYVAEDEGYVLAHAEGTCRLAPGVLAPEDPLAVAARAGGFVARDEPGSPLAGSAAVEALLPLLLGEVPVGLVLLGEQRSGDSYTSDDIALLGTLATYIALALDNVLQYARLEALNAELEARVAARTAQLAAANTALERERASLASALDILPLPLAIFDFAGGTARANDSVMRFFDQGPLTQQPEFDMLDPVTRTVIPDDQRPRARAMRGEVVPGQEVIVRLPNGRETPILGYAGPVRVDGQQTGVVVAFQDITALKEADRAKDAFLACLSHEMKTPLTCIIAWTEVARQVRPEMSGKALAVIEDNAQRLRRLLDDLLDLSRVLHDKMYLQRMPCDLWQLAAQVAEDHHHLLAEQGITLMLEPPADPMPVSADPARMGQVLGNLLDNARKFTDGGGLVRVRGYRHGDCAAVAVMDTGCGVPVDELDSVFTRFRQARSSHVRRGLGIGLALVKGIVEQHGGRVVAESPGPGQGATFTILLPAAPAPRPSTSREAERAGVA